jgi:DNA-binding transcriptional ArsR family regulator
LESYERLLVMHLLPADRAQLRLIDEEKVCRAIAALEKRPEFEIRARYFALLSDPTRLKLLTCIRHAGPISVSDLAAATGLAEATVSQTLRHLRASQVVDTHRDGRVIRYKLTDPRVAELLRA